MKRNERIRLFVREIWTWYVRHKRTLPWRDLPDRDPVARAYKILVSEIMLQQTQVSRVIVKYKEFLERFPTIQDLAGASNRDVLIAWRGMGYNSRALRLRDAAKTVRSFGLRVTSCEYSKLETQNRVKRHVPPRGFTCLQPSFPCEMEDLASIKGIGTYTAAAIRNFAFGIATPCIDTNIRRILHRTFVGPEYPDGSWEKDDAYLLAIADEVLRVAGCPADWHAALMDFGALVQTKRNPRWQICPLTREGIMKTTRKSYELKAMSDERLQLTARSSQLQEPGRYVGSVFTPNRIFRGRIVDALRDAPGGLTLERLGSQVAIDWDRALLRAWLQDVLRSLVRDGLIRRSLSGRFILG